MLTPRERDSWHEIQRRLADDPPPLSPVLAALALTTLLLAGPRRRTEAELAERRRPPPPRKSSAPPGPGPGAYLAGTSAGPDGDPGPADVVIPLPRNGFGRSAAR